MLIIGIPIAAYWGTLAYVNHQLDRRTYQQVYNECHKLWSNRGLVGEGVARNSIQSVLNAFSHQAAGVEIDYYYDTDLKKFVVSHDFPYGLIENRLLTLQELFEAVDSPGHYYWLDFKKLRKLEDKQVDDAVARLEYITSNNDLKRRVYVEGEDPLHLAYFQRAGFNTIFDTHPLADRYPLSVFLINVYKIVYYFGRHTVLGLNYSYHGAPIYSGENKAALSNVPVFVYHTPDDPELVKRLVSDPAVKVVLNSDETISNFHINSCR